jgi:hypothetical protein
MKHIKVRVGKYLFDNCPIENSLIQGDALSPLLFNFDLEYVIRKVQDISMINSTSVNFWCEEIMQHVSRATRVYCHSMFILLKEVWAYHNKA